MSEPFQRQVSPLMSGIKVGPILLLTHIIINASHARNGSGGHYPEPIAVLFRFFKSNASHQKDRIWQQYTAISSSGMRLASREPMT
jgi:hypothetical protein